MFSFLIPREFTRCRFGWSVVSVLGVDQREKVLVRLRATLYSDTFACWGSHAYTSMLEVNLKTFGLVVPTRV